MPIEVETPDGIVEFPDDTDSATIESALRRRFSPPPSPVMSDDEFSDFESSFLQPKPALGFEPTDIRQVPGISQEVAGVFGGDREQPQGEAREILGDPLAFAFTPFSVFGRPLNAAVQDIGATIAGAPELGGNLYELATRDAPVFSSEPLPYQETLADISKDYPAIATAGKVAAGLVESAPMLSIMPQGAMGKLVAAGFTADMIGNAGEAATRLGAEMGKAPKDRDADAITSALSEIILAAGPAPFAGAHAGGRFVGERIAPRAEAIRELAKTLKNEPFVQGDRPIQINRELGIPKAPLTAEPFLQPGVRELADAALREAQSPIARTDPAIEQLRREIEPPQIIPIEPTRVAERIEGGGEAPYGKTSFMREAEAPTAERTQLAREIERQLAVEEPVPAAEPINPGGSQQSLPDALRTKSEQNNSLKALRDAGLDPSLFPDEKSKRAGIKREIAKLESESAGASAARAKTISEKLAALKFKADKNGKVIPDDPGQVFSLPHPDAVKQIGKQLWNDSIDAAIKALEAGKTVAQAVEAAIRKIAYNAGRGYNEAKIRANLESILRDEAAPKPAEVQKVIAPEQQRKADAGLDDVYRIFEPEKKPGTPIKQRAINVAEAVRTGFSSKFRPINKLAEDISKSYGRGSSRDIAGIMEQLKGSQGKGEAQVYRFDRDVSRLVRGREKDFNAYMFLRRSLDRLQQDAADIAKAQAGGDVKQINRRSVGRYTIPELESKLSTLESKLGPEILPKFEKAAEGYQRYMDEALRLQVESGRMSPEVYRAIKEGNEFYAPFKVMKYLEEQSRPEGSGGKIDTTAGFTKAMIGIEDPNFKLGDMLGAARQSILLSRILADKNSAMRHVAELAAFDVDGRFIQRLKPNAEPPLGWEAVNVIENGKTVKYATRPEVADALQLYGGTGGGIVSRTLSAFSVPFRAGATALNLPFQVSNLIADVPRQALVSKYGVRNAADLVRYPMDFAHALFSSISGDVFGRDSKLFLDFLDSGVAGTTIQEYLTPQALKFREPTTISKSRKLASSVINVIPEFAKAIEQTSKVMGVKRAMRIEGVKSGAELAKKIPEAITELRRFSGSPDFGRQGKVVEQARLNLLYMFLNARIQGAVADVGRLAGRDGAKTAATTWFKIGTAVGIPTAYLYALNQSDEFKEDYAKRSKQEKDNYWLIPKDSYITTEDGEKLRDYWRIPKRESSKWMANLTEAALDFAQERDPKAMAEFAGKMVQELSPVNVSGETARERLESVASSLNPVLKAPLELASGRDFYRHRDIIPDSMQEASPERQFTPRTAEAFKKLAEAMPDVAPEFLRSPLLLENITRNLTAGLLTQFLKLKPVEGRSNIENAALLQRFQALPYADNEAFKQEMRQLERVAADEYLARHRTAEKLIKDNPRKPLHEIAMQANGDVRLVRHLADLWIAQQNGATSQDKQLLSLPARQRATYIANQLKEMNTEQKQQAIQGFARKRILTEAVLQEMPENFEQ